MTGVSDALILQNRHNGEQMHLRRIMKDGKTALALWGSLGPRSQGPLLHLHCAEDEQFHVIAGTLSAQVNGRQVRLSAGETTTFRAGSAHRWWNDGDETLLLDGFVTPLVDFDVYIQGAFDVLNASPADRPSLFYMAHLAWRHRRTQVALFIPRPVQAVLIPIVVFVGTMIGKYRGGDWPGAPGRCTGAPRMS